MNNYYFTFGTNHRQKDGTPMKNYWIRVISDDWSKARSLFVDKFSSVYMEEPDKWAFQYTDKDFDPSWYTGGEYLIIT